MLVMSRVPRGRRWLQWSLRSILLLTAASALAMGVFVSRYRREQQSIAWLKTNDAKYSTELSGPAWLQRVIGPQFFEHVTVVEIDGAHSDDKPTPLAEADFRRLQSLPCLRELSLPRSALTEEQFRRFGDFSALRKLYVSQQFPIKSIEELLDARPELDLNLARAEELYRLSAFVYAQGEELTRTLIFAHYSAAEWKLECAKYKRAGAKVAALRQLIANLERVPKPPYALPPTDAAVLRCAIARAKLDVARALGNAGEEAAVLEETRQSAETMLALFRQAMADDSLDVCDFDFAWQLASEPLLAGRSAEDAACLALHEQRVDDYQKLLSYADRLSLVDRQSLTPICWRTLAEFGLAMAKAELSEFRGDSTGADHTLAEAKDLAADLRLALRSAVDDVQLDALTAVQFCQRSYDADKSLNQSRESLNQSREDPKASPAKSRELEVWLAHLFVASHQYCYDNLSQPMLSNLLGTARLRRRGRRAYEGTFADLLNHREESVDAFESSGNAGDAPPAPNSL